MLLIDDLLFWLPSKGLLGILKKIEEQAAGEHKNTLKDELLAANNDFELGRINKEEYEMVEKSIIKQLENYSNNKR